MDDPGESLYHYKAKCIRVLDGDTVDVSIDLGFDIAIKKTIRLYGINTKEINSKNLIEKEAAINARIYLKDKILDKDLIINTVKKKDKYGRCLAVIYLEPGGLNINMELIDRGFAERILG